MRKENEEQIDLADQKLRSQVLIHRPDVYKKIYENEEDDRPQLIQMTPQSDAEIEEIMNDMKRLGMPIK